MTIEEYKNKFEEIASQLLKEHGKFDSIVISPVPVLADWGETIDTKFDCKISF